MRRVRKAGTELINKVPRVSSEIIKFIFTLLGYIYFFLLSNYDEFVLFHLTIFHSAISRADAQDPEDVTKEEKALILHLLGHPRMPTILWTLALKHGAPPQTSHLLHPMTVK